ncbi:TPA: hypothetical protein SBA37_000776 [Campylobacter jejuni]|nr:hypothetical protein [Campylobacter jejuni]HEF8735027.1 hypothetical protein [Campylobacter jejuni]
MNIINEFFVSFILIKLYFKFKVCRKIKFPLLWKFYFSKWKFYFSADKNLFDKNFFDPQVTRWDGANPAGYANRYQDYTEGRSFWLSYKYDF